MNESTSLETPPEQPETPDNLSPEPAGPPKRLKISLLVVGILLLVGGGVLAFMKNREHVAPTAPVAQDITQLKVGLVEGPLDRFYPDGPLSTGNFTLDRQVFEGLVRYDQQAKIIPLLATGWTNPSDDTWVFQLRHGVKFHTGRTMTASDVKASLLARDNGFTQAYGTTIKKVDVVDDYTIKITTDGPDPILLNRLSLLFIFDASSKVKNSPSDGTGPYELKTGTKPTADAIDLTAFADYWGGHAYTRELDFRVLPTEAKMSDALRSHKINTGLFLATGGPNHWPMLALASAIPPPRPCST